MQELKASNCIILLFTKDVFFYSRIYIVLHARSSHLVCCEGQCSRLKYFIIMKGFKIKKKIYIFANFEQIQNK